MAGFTRQAGVWQAFKGMFIHNGTSFVNAKQGWVYNAGAWRIFYPEIPINTALPTISGTAAYQYTLTASQGTWNSNGAYTPTSYSYQWLREGVAIAGATASTRVCDANDVGKNISVRVTATNGRGSVNATSTTVFVLPVMTTITLSDSTVVPSSPSGLTGSQDTAIRSWKCSWTGPATGTNVSGYEVTADKGSVTYTSPNTSATGLLGSSDANPVVVSVKTTNDNYRVTASWNSVVGATSYVARLDSGTNVDIGNVTSITYTTTSANHTVSVYPMINTTYGIGNTSNGITPVTAKSTASTVSITVKIPIIPTISGTSVSTSDTNGTLMTVSWSSTNQSTYSISVSPRTGGVSGNTLFTGNTATSRYIGVGTVGTSYSITVTVTSSTGDTASESITFKAGKVPTTPGDPTLTYRSSGNTTTRWGYTVSFATSTGSTPITYYIEATGIAGGYDAVSTTTSPFNFTLSKSDTTWRVRLFASNSVGDSGWTNYSAYV